MDFMVWAKFVFMMILIWIFGNRAARSADAIAEHKGWGRAFMGVVFISAITSFPEMATGISALALVSSPNLAVGEIIGSCLFNLSIIGLVDCLLRPRAFYTLVGRQNVITICFGLMMITMLAFFLVLPRQPAWGRLGLVTLIVFVSYLAAIYFVTRDRREGHVARQDGVKKDIRRETISFVFSALVIIAVGTYLPVLGKEIALLMGWQETFVGVFFLALVTSFPELVISFSAIRIGAIDMFFGNIAGSNLFNLAMLFIFDLVHPKPIMAAVASSTLPVLHIVMLMNVLVLTALYWKKDGKTFRRLSWFSLALLLLFLVGVVVTY